MKQLDRIPARSLRQIESGEKRGDIDCIIDYLTAREGSEAVVLTDKQQNMLARIQKVDNLYSTGQYTKKDVISIMVQTFAISNAAAQKDVENAMFVFGSFRDGNKSYRLLMLVENLEEIITKLTRKEMYDLIPRFYAEYRAALDMLEDDKAMANAPAPIVFNVLQQNQITVNPAVGPVDETKAFQIAAERLAKRGVDITKIDGAGNGI